MYTEKNGLQQNGSSMHNNNSGHRPINLYFHEIPAINLKKALVNGEKYMDVLGEMIGVTETAFAFIRYSELDQPVRDAMYQLERQFEFYKRLLGR